MKKVVLSFTPNYLPGFKSGGPIKTAKNLISSLSEFDFNFHLVTSDRDLGDTKPFSNIKADTWCKVGHANVIYIPKGIVGYYRIIRIIQNGSYDIIYFNSFFSFKFSIFPQLVSRCMGKSVIIGSRGVFSLEAIRFKALKKRLFLKLYKLLGFNQNAIFQATSSYEVFDIQRALGKKNDIWIAEDIAAQEFASDLGKKAGCRLKIVFVARISPIKNLYQALVILKETRENIEFDIYGPIENEEYWVQCETLARSLPPRIKVRYLGPLNPSKVVETMTEYDLFFMPTLGENYGHTIVEALCAGLPVLISDATPWRSLDELDIGWDIPLEHTWRFVEVINNFAAMSENDRISKRKKVLEWAKTKFSQRDAVNQHIAMFNYAYEKSRKQ